MVIILNTFEYIYCGFVEFDDKGIGCIGTNRHGLGGNRSRLLRLVRCREALPVGGGDIILTDCTYSRVCTAVCI